MFRQELGLLAAKGEEVEVVAKNAELVFLETFWEGEVWRERQEWGFPARAEVRWRFHLNT